MKNIIMMIMITLSLAACNSVSMTPASIEPGAKVFADRGGYSMRRSIKERLEKRGYNVVVGNATTSRDITNDSGDSIDIESSRIPKDVRYFIKVRERRETFNPFWCPLNGFWWWNFNVSIADQKTGDELMTWRGRGCANSSLRKLDQILDMMEIKDDNTKTTDTGNS